MRGERLFQRPRDDEALAHRRKEQARVRVAQARAAGEMRMLRQQTQQTLPKRLFKALSPGRAKRRVAAAPDGTEITDVQ